MGLFRIHVTDDLPQPPEGYKWAFEEKMLFHKLYLKKHWWGPFYKTVDSSPILDYQDAHPGGMWRTSWNPKEKWTDDILIEVANYLLATNIRGERPYKGNR